MLVKLRYRRENFAIECRPVERGGAFGQGPDLIEEPVFLCKHNFAYVSTLDKQQKDPKIIFWRRPTRAYVVLSTGLTAWAKITCIRT